MVPLEQNTPDSYTNNQSIYCSSVMCFIDSCRCITFSIFWSFECSWIENGLLLLKTWSGSFEIHMSTSYQNTPISSFELHTFYNDLIRENLHIMVIFGIFSFAWTSELWIVLSRILSYGKVDFTFSVLIICTLILAVRE